MDILERKLPFDIESEMALLGSIFQSPERCDDVRSIVAVQDFYDDANKRLFDHMQAMRDEGLAIDVVLMVNRLKQAGDFEAVGGSAYLFKVCQSAPNAAHAKHYAKIVADKAKLRAIINACVESLKDAYEDPEDVLDVLSRAEARLFDLRDERSVKVSEPVGTCAKRCIEAIQKHLDGDGEIAVPTGFFDLDNMLGGGMRDSEMVLVAARPSLGKSSLAADIALHVANTRLVHFASIEMTSENLTERMLSGEANVAGSRIRKRELGESTMGLLREAGERLESSNLYLDDNPRQRVADISASVRITERRTGQKVGLIVVDYLQNATPDDEKANREQQVAKIAKGLKRLAKEHKCPVLCVAAVNRQNEHGNDKRPKLSHLRESGSLEFDADVVLFIHREEYYLRDQCPEEDRGIAEISIAKQRNGPCGIIKLRWDEAHTRFQNLTSARHGEFDEYNDNDRSFR